MRLIFIPGFGEDESVFEKLHPHLPGEKVFLDNWSLLPDREMRGLNVLQYSADLVRQFNITEEDVVIGHSMGGWIAWHIKHLVYCPIVQIASWTDPGKVVAPTRNLPLIFWATKKKVVLNHLVKKLTVWKYYKGKPSMEVYRHVFENMVQGNKDNVNNQFRLIFNPVREKVQESPDLRIHARADTIVRFPDESTFEVPGDHFCLYTYPEKVVPPIVALLKKVKKRH
ncbi:alpha/beta fold hydrolase [Nafulsella turpanensis]|uniref:alpha/beta fold hydrolase n=1 Tax=Nafulsella turpanensis TaxID=1265690 RepID=UPI0003497050|nr:alpha/beta hydrolase [Nafulsella turpanensis]